MLAMQWPWLAVQVRSRAPVLQFGHHFGWVHFNLISEAIAAVHALAPLPLHTHSTHDTLKQPSTVALAVASTFKGRVQQH